MPILTENLYATDTVVFLSCKMSECVQWSLSLIFPPPTHTVRGVVQTCTKSKTKENRGVGGKCLVVTLQHFLVEEQVCLRVEYSWLWYRLNRGVTDVHPLALGAAAGIPRTWQVPVVLFCFPLGRTHFYICGVVAPPHWATVFNNPIKTVDDALTSCQVLAKTNEISKKENRAKKWKMQK